MKRFNQLFTALLISLVATFAVTACDKKDDDHDEVVESGTYEGTIDKVNASENEIYVDSDGKELELYFTETTTLTQGDSPVEFAVLEKGQRVEVTVEKVGQRLDPISVKILE